MDEETLMVTEDGDILSVVAWADEDMIEVDEANAFYAIVRRDDGELEAVEIIEAGTVH